MFARFWPPKTTSAAAVLKAAIGSGLAPGLQYVAVRREGVVFAAALGCAHIQSGRLVEPETTFMAYSMSKTITAVAVLQLVERGKVGLDDAIGKHMDDAPWGGAATIRQLLCHTGGAPNPLPLKWTHSVADDATFDEGAALSAVLAANPSPASAPGERFAYSNVGYWLLGALVETVSGEPFRRYVQSHVIAPLGVSDSALGYAVATPERHAGGYLERASLFNLLKCWLIDPALIGAACGRWQEILPHIPNGAAFGGLIGCAAGIAEFLQDQLGERSALLSDKARSWLESPQTAGGRAIPMTLGWHIGGSRSGTFFYKEGGGGGFHSMMRLYRDRGFASVLVTNATRINVGQLVDLVDRQFL